jgi:hypothetical protein
LAEIVKLYGTQRSGIAAGGVLEFLLPFTVAKLKN